MSENPYLSPTDAALSATPVSADVADQGLQTIARKTFLAWEKLRVVYVTILALITLLIIAVTGSLSERLRFMVLEGAIVANVAYFAGPVVETYVKWLGYDRQWPRWVMFTGGMLLSIVLAVGVLATEWLPDPN